MRVVESGEFFLEKPPTEVIEMLKKPEIIATLIPGVSKIIKIGDEYVGEVLVKLGHLSGKMSVKFKYGRTDQGGVAVVGRATGLQTTADFTIEARVEPSVQGSLVKWKFESEARGLAASLAPSIVQNILRKMALETAQNLVNYLKS